MIDYPRSGYTGLRRWVPSWRFVVGSIASVTAFGVVAFLVLWFMIPLPDIQTANATQASKVYYANGKQMGSFSAENRVVLDSLDQIPKHVQNSVLAIEDHTFWENGGVSITGTVRAALNNLRGGAKQGGSTITQQYVKNVTNDQAQTASRKIREFIISIKVAQSTKKEDILLGYLNTIYFGRSAYGIQAASKAYFNKDVSKLSVSEGAFLAGIINGPELYDPRDGKNSTARATTRWEKVLNDSVSYNYIAASDRDKIIKAGLPPTVVQKESGGGDPQWGYARQMIRNEATNEFGMTDFMLASGGYNITTTLDQNMMREATEAVANKMGPRSKWPAGTQVGLASVEPSTGALKAFYGGDFSVSQQNAASQDAPQGGSTYKVFGLVAALGGVRGDGTGEQMSLKSRFNGDSKYRIGQAQENMREKDKITIYNFGDKSYGCIDLIAATANSVNTVYAQINEAVGGRGVARVAYALGLPQKMPAGYESISTGGVNVLGSGNVTPWTLASIYGVIANEGSRHVTYMIDTIEKDKKPQFSHEDFLKNNPDSRPFNQSVMADTTYALSQVVNGGSGAYASNLGRPAAGKTGTAALSNLSGNDSKNDNVSAWFVGFTPQLSTAVNIHNTGANGAAQAIKPWTWNGYSPGVQVTGGSYPVRVWTDYMQKALKGQPIKPLPQPSWGGQVIYGSGCSAAPEPSVSPTASPSVSGSLSVSGTVDPSGSVDPSASDTNSVDPSVSATGSPAASATKPGRPKNTPIASIPLPTNRANPGGANQ